MFDSWKVKRAPLWTACPALSDTVLGAKVRFSEHQLPVILCKEDVRKFKYFIKQRKRELCYDKAIRRDVKSLQL
ncbi:hypothetical protein DXA13_16315 [Clostridium sp. AM58-1XD]|nr:hypothetical protein DXA13_16315 [Clostridium sp. AM58-1XD]